MTKSGFVAMCFFATTAGALFVACADYSDPNKTPTGAPVPGATATAQPSPTGTVFAAPPVADGGKIDPCANRAYRGGSPNSVVCPGVASCECEGPAVCCMQKVDGNTGSCTALAACRNIAIQCDGPEDCGGGVCCLEDRSGGGTSCKASANCASEWLCRSDNDCTGAPRGTHCAPADFGVQGVSDKGLDGIIGICGAK